MKNIMEKYKYILVVGLGFRSGLTVANFLASKNFKVAVSDMKESAELSSVVDRLDDSVETFLGYQKPELLDKGFDLIVLSPGVPVKTALVQEAVARGIEVISEVEMAFRFMKGHVVSITGTDGKSTTTALTGEIFKKLGFKTFVGGNIGITLTSLVDSTDDDSVTVVELSSFQLETLDTYCSDVAAILNVAPDHLDRYDGMDEYFYAKKNIYKNHKTGNRFIYNYDNEMMRESSKEYPPGSWFFSLSNEKAMAFYKDGFIYINDKGQEQAVLDCSRFKVMGMHNVENAMAALLIAVGLLQKLNMEVDFDAIASACYSFPGLAHRLEYIGEYEGRKFINDSKATTVGALEVALKSIPEMGVLIMGGRTKGDDYARLKPLLLEKVRTLVLIGESAREFSEMFEEVDSVIAEDMNQAVVKAWEKSREGDIVLLSPACASFDMFGSYEERGEKFREAFENMKEGLK